MKEDKFWQTRQDNVTLLRKTQVARMDADMNIHKIHFDFEFNF